MDGEKKLSPLTFRFFFGIGFLRLVLRFQFLLMLEQTPGMFLVRVRSFAQRFDVALGSSLEWVRKRICFSRAKDAYVNFFGSEQGCIVDRARCHFFHENGRQVVHHRHLRCCLCIESGG